jgi:hypothetical protein
MAPVTLKSDVSTAEAWRHYMREDIAPLFGLAFNPAIWNQGFIAADGHVIILVTLDKGGLNKDHRYEDHFLSPDRFQWQSQNRTKQDSNHGRLIRTHKERGVPIHLFVRNRKVLDGQAAPFVYCGEVAFESWEGEQPISVIWQLREAVPVELRGALNVPDDPR